MRRLILPLLIAVAPSVGLADEKPAPNGPPDRQGWKLTFSDGFNRPTLNDMYWYPAYRSGRKEYFKRIGHPSRWHDHNAHYVIEDGILKLRIDKSLPARPEAGTRCVSSVQTSDRHFGATTADIEPVTGRVRIRDLAGGVKSLRVTPFLPPANR